MMQINTFSHRLLSAHDRLCVLHVMFCSEIQLFRSLNDFYNRQHFVLQYGNFIERWKEIEFGFYFAILFPSDRQSFVRVFLVYWKIFWLIIIDETELTRWEQRERVYFQFLLNVSLENVLQVKYLNNRSVYSWIILKSLWCVYFKNNCDIGTFVSVTSLV